MMELIQDFWHSNRESMFTNIELSLGTKRCSHTNESRVLDLSEKCRRLTTG